MTKRLLSYMAALLLLFSLAACGRNPAGTPDTGIPPVAAPEDDPFDVEGHGEAGTVAVDSEKSAYNPLTGEYTLAEDRVGMRPIAVSVNNLAQSWPQYGISGADYILEIETEGGITRMMCLFSDTREVHTIGSVRSLRDQFMEALYPLDPIIVHIGTSIYADRAISQYNYRTLDGGSYPSAIWTDTDRLQQGYATEHCKFTGGEAIEKGIAAANLNTATGAVISAFNFADPEGEKVIPASGGASSVKYNFSSYYDGDFRYDEATGSYLKWQFGKMQVDAGNGDQQLAFENVFLLFADISPIAGTSLVSVGFAEGGSGYYFSEGRYEEITWTKADYPSNFTFLTADGEELLVNVGKTHIGVVDDDYVNRLVITP